jgi:uncharacterized protein (TIGR02246 family)
MRHAGAVLTVASLTLAVTGTAVGGQPGRPLLVTVDDLPVAAGSLHADAAERERITSELLAALGKHRVPAVGFVIWGHVAGARDEQLLERWLEAGHELGNHSANHLDYASTPAEAYVADVEAGRAGLAGFLGRHGKAVRFFRFPFLAEGDTAAKLDAMRAYLAKSGQVAMPVTIDDQDWSYEEQFVTARKAGDRAALTRVDEEYQGALRAEIVSQTELGDQLFSRSVPQILLLHANEVGTANWDALFTWLEQRGYRFATADEVMADPAITAPHHFVAGPGGSLWFRLSHERSSEKAREDVLQLLRTQAEAWSRGDLETFCRVYAEDAVFISPSGMTQGRQEVLERYRKRYSTPAAMGTLALEPLEVREAWGTEVSLLGDAVPSRVHGVSVVARWTIAKSDGTTATGLTLLVLHRKSGSWQIVQDASM